MQREPAVPIVNKARLPTFFCRECFNCQDPGHFVAVCLVIQQKEKSERESPAAVGVVQREPKTSHYELWTEGSPPRISPTVSEGN